MNQETIFRQIFILLLLGVISVLSSITGKDHQVFEPELSVPNKQLFWDGSDLVFANEAGQGAKYAKPGSIPIELNSLFFQPFPLNKAKLEHLLTVPGIGPKLAQEILYTKKLLGKFEKPEDLLQVSGIGKHKLHLFINYFSFE